jgi:hypothetical protein
VIILINSWLGLNPCFHLLYFIDDGTKTQSMSRWRSAGTRSFTTISKLSKKYKVFVFLGGLLGFEMRIGLGLRALKLQRDNALSAMPVSVCVCAPSIVLLMLCEELLVMISHPYPWWPLGPCPCVDTILLYTHMFGMKDNPPKRQIFPHLPWALTPPLPSGPIPSLLDKSTFISFNGLLFLFSFAFQCDGQHRQLLFIWWCSSKKLFCFTQLESKCECVLIWMRNSRTL